MAKPQPFVWTFSSGSDSMKPRPNDCWGEDTYRTFYGRGSVHGRIEFPLHFCGDMDRYPTGVPVGSPGGAALSVRTAGKWPLPVTVYVPDGRVLAGRTVLLNFDPPFGDQGSGGVPIPGGDYLVVIEGDSRDMYGLIEVGMSYADWVASHALELKL